MESKFPKLKWAQRAECVLMTIEQADCEGIAIDIDESKNTLNFEATSSGQKYGFSMELFDKVVKDESKWNTKGRNIIINVSKKDKEQEEWWPRLTKDKAKNQQITIDWDKWVDPDDEPEDDDKGGMGDFDPSLMQGMGGGGGMPGMPGMPGMGGMGGPGAGGMDMAAMQQMLAGMGGGAGGPGGMDPAKMKEMMAGMNMGGDDDDDDDAKDEEESKAEPHTAE